MATLVVAELQRRGRGNAFTRTFIRLRLNDCLGACAVQAGLDFRGECRVLYVFRYAGPVAAGLLIDPGDRLPERGVAPGLSGAFGKPGLSCCGRLVHGEWQMVPLQVRLGVPVDPCPEQRVVALAVWAFQIGIQHQRKARAGLAVTPWRSRLKTLRDGVVRTGLCG